jgi:hypothetical protein
MLLLNTKFKIASIFRLGIPLFYALFVSILFPDFVREHEILANGILLPLPTTTPCKTGTDNVGYIYSIFDTMKKDGGHEYGCTKTDESCHELY